MNNNRSKTISTEALEPQIPMFCIRKMFGADLKPPIHILPLRIQILPRWPDKAWNFLLLFISSGHYSQLLMIK